MAPALTQSHLLLELVLVLLSFFASLKREKKSLRRRVIDWMTSDKSGQLTFLSSFSCLVRILVGGGVSSGSLRSIEIVNNKACFGKIGF